MKQSLIQLDSKEELYVTSRAIAKACNIKHYALIKLIKKYTKDLEKLGKRINPMLMKIEKTVGRPAIVCHFNFEQTLLILSRTRNSERTNKIVEQLILAFSKTNKALALKEILETFDAEDLPPDRYVYVAKEITSGRYKIGISRNPERRIKELNIGNPEDLILFHVYKATEHGYLSETLAHKTLEAYHIRSEWFSEDADISQLPYYKGE